MRMAKTLKPLCTTFAAVALLAGAMRPASAEIVTFHGDTTFGPTYLRASPWGGGTPDFVTGVTYRAFDVSVTVSDWMYSFVTHCDFNCTSFFYQDSFDPLQPQKNLMSADGNDGYQFTALMAAMDPGHKYVYVVAGYYDYDWGAFGTTVGGKGAISISAVPEPATGAMLLAGLAGLGMAARRRRGRMA